MYEIYTDGSAAPNPGPGGYGVVIIETSFGESKIVETFAESSEKTTNNREEMKAMIVALQWVKTQSFDETYVIYCDSAYVVNTCTSWIYKWQKNGWKKKHGAIVENIDIVTQLYDLVISTPQARIEKINGHTGLIGNELADAAATKNENKFNIYKSKLEHLLIFNDEVDDGR